MQRYNCITSCITSTSHSPFSRSYSHSCCLQFLTLHKSFWHWKKSCSVRRNLASVEVLNFDWTPCKKCPSDAQKRCYNQMNSSSTTCMSWHSTFASQIANFASHIKLSPSKVRFCTEIFGFAHFCNLCSKNGTFCCEFESPSWLPFRSRPESRKFPPQTPSKMPLRRTEMPLSSKEVATQDLFIVEANFCLSEAKFEFAFKTFASETLLWWKIYAWNCFCSLISENRTVWQHFDICICWSKKLALLSDFQLFSPLLLAFSK